MIRRVVCGLGLSWAMACAPAAAQIVRVADLNTTQIRALDRARTVVMLPGGISWAPACIGDHPMSTNRLAAAVRNGRAFTGHLQ